MKRRTFLRTSLAAAAGVMLPHRFDKYPALIAQVSGTADVRTAVGLDATAAFLLGGIVIAIPVGIVVVC